MRQAIEEGFIMNVLDNYTTYDTYFQLLKETENDPEVERKKAARELSKFMRLHPHNIAQKTEVMVEHFQSVTRHKIGGKAKAMVVASSRLETVRYKQQFDKYISENDYDLSTLVAFSGTVQDDKVEDKTYTEKEMNDGISDKELPQKFSTSAYQLLLVAEKYQTGFDEPLLHTMYVDRRLSGLQAVQTLSRLNRTHPLKEDTFVLDFVNDREEIRRSFSKFYDGVGMGEEPDPARMYQLKAELDESGIYHQDELERFCKVYFKPKRRQSTADHEEMNAALDPAVERFTELRKENEEEAEEWRSKVGAFRNLYSYLSQIIPYQDSDLEQLYTFLRHLSNKLPRRSTGQDYQFDDEVRLEYYRLQKISEGSIDLGEPDEKPTADGPTETGTGKVHEDSVALSRLIDQINERFGTDFTESDQLFFDQLVEEAMSYDSLQQAAKTNPRKKFALIFEDFLETLIVERMDQNEEIFARWVGDKDFRKLVDSWLTDQTYRRLSE
jgi:type I restriction enzyme R subunit